MTRFVSAAVLLAAATLYACVDEPTYDEATSAVISDDPHGGQVDFFFLPPVVPAPAHRGDFLPDLAPVVTAEQLAPSGAVLRNLGTWTRTSTGAEKVRVHINGAAPDDGDGDPTGYFVVRFRSAEMGVAGGDLVRFHVKLDGRELGLADVKVLDKKKDKNLIDRSEYGFVVAGNVLRVKFRIDRGALAGGGGGGGGSGSGSSPDAGVPSTPAKVMGYAIGAGIGYLVGQSIAFVPTNGGPVVTTGVGADGQFRATVPPGEVTMVARATGFTAFEQRMYLQPADEVIQDVLVQPTLCWVDVHVRDASFALEGGASVTLKFNGATIASGTTDTAGEYLFVAQPCGAGASIDARNAAGFHTAGDLGVMTPGLASITLVLTE